MTELPLWPVALGVLGLIFGSFIATGAVRWPEGLSPVAGRSRCDHCGETLTSIELIPLVSFAMQRGKCRRCGGRIAAVHPAIEGLGLAIGVAAGIAAPGWTGLTGAAFGWILLLLGALDLRAFWLPNLGTGGLALLGLIVGFTGVEPILSDRIVGGIVGFGMLWLVARGYRWMRARTGLGGGDPKLMGAIGMWLGWQALPMLLLGASLIGLSVALAMMIARRRIGATTRLPFGTMLAVAAFPLWLINAIA